MTNFRGQTQLSKKGPSDREMYPIARETYRLALSVHEPLTTTGVHCVVTSVHSPVAEGKNKRHTVSCDPSETLCISFGLHLIYVARLTKVFTQSS